jgi:hypothetical protein
MGCVGVAALLSACASSPFEEAKIDPASPIAPEVARLATANTDYPSFSEIPAIPKDVRPKRLYGEAAREVEQTRAAVERESAEGTWTLQNTEAFANRARGAAGADAAVPAARGTEAFAEELRQRATPPPPPRN